ncbi:unnamed protein product [Somion occarium]|uniref:Elongator complex protein 5 n=1 Tax=Somion occarium TaxID=3059160 RepID=A0ABP1D0E1_9APHY
MATLFPPSSPALPAFRSLIVEGNYHASAPIHLCLSHLAQSGSKRAILLLPSRTKFTAALKKLNDDWLNQHGGEGKCSRLARHIDILYPPTPAHLAFLLSMFHQAQDSDKVEFTRKTTFAAVPSLLVLCELSSYLAGNPDATISSYLSMVSQALSCASSLLATSGSTVSLAVFDSGLTDLKLPILRPVFMQALEKERHSTEQPEQKEDPIPNAVPVAFLAHRFFDWIGEFTRDQESHRPSNFHTFKLRRQPSSNEDEIIWRWRERQNTTSSGQQSITFMWI